jgi:hypothetical protein
LGLRGSSSNDWIIPDDEEGMLFVLNKRRAPIIGGHDVGFLNGESAAFTFRYAAAISKW